MNKNGKEYSLMQEAIGQLMTLGVFMNDVILAVAVPYSEKLYELAKGWRVSTDKTGWHCISFDKR